VIEFGNHRWTFFSARRLVNRSEILPVPYQTLFQTDIREVLADMEFAVRNGKLNEEAISLISFLVVWWSWE
jgi:hypothetical protein